MATTGANRSDVPRALVFMPARDCELYVADAISSLARQTFDDLHVLFVDDASRDDTGIIARRHLEALFPGRHTYVRNESPWGKARNAHVHLRASVGEADFVAVLDGDDQLVDATILREMATQYAAGSDVVWTNYVSDSGVKGCNGPLDPLTPPRLQGWKSSHFFSFRAELLAAVDEAYFKDARGAWLPAACDQALAYPVLDQTRRYTFLPVAAYRYTATNPNSHHNRDPRRRGFDSQIQSACAREVLQKRPLPCTRPAMRGGAPEEAALRSVRDGLGADHRALLQRLDDVERRLSQGAWQQAAATQLAARCPSVLDLVASPQSVAWDAIQAWSLLRLLQARRPRPRVLEIGAGPWAAPLAAMVRDLEGAFWSVSGEARRAGSLVETLRQAMGACPATVLATAMAEVEFCGLRGRFPDLAVLADERDFDLVLVSVAEAVSDEIGAVLALPAMADRLSREGFALCVLTGSRELQRGAAACWERLSPELRYAEACWGGHALVVSSD